MDQTKKLIALIKQLSYREGDFVLASGQKSRFYIDMKATTLHPEGAWLIGKVMAAQIIKLDLKVDAVGGMTLGADPIATALSLAGRELSQHWPAYIVRKEAKGHGTGKTIEGAENLKPGARLVVLEDVTTTGGTAMQAVDKLRDAGYQPVLLATVVDRQQGAAELFKKQGMDFLALTHLAALQQSEF